MTTRPPVDKPVEYGNATSFWVEYPSGLVDLTRSAHLSEAEAPAAGVKDSDSDSGSGPPLVQSGQLEIAVDGRTIRVDAKKSALVVIDMQK